LSGKPGNVGEFNSCQGNVGEKSCQRQLPKTVYCKLHICMHAGIY